MKYNQQNFSRRNIVEYKVLILFISYATHWRAGTLSPSKKKCQISEKKKKKQLKILWLYPEENWHKLVYKKCYERPYLCLLRICKPGTTVNVAVYLATGEDKANKRDVHTLK